MRMLANVQQKTIQPIIEAAVAKGVRIHTDEYDIYARLPAWGYPHKTVCHARGEYDPSCWCPHRLGFDTNSR
jgi:transposase